MSAAAAYPMYQLAPMRPWIECWWQGLAQHCRRLGLDVPATLRLVDADQAHYLDPDLWLSQTCGYPFTHVLKDRVQYLATPCYDTLYNRQAEYCSLILIRGSDPASNLRGTEGYRLAFNSFDSQSGYHALRYELAQIGISGSFFSAGLKTGVHRHSMQQVLEGNADVCAVDCVTYNLLKQYCPEQVRGLRVLQTTSLAPGLPLITSLARPAGEIEGLRQALKDSARDPALRECHQALLIKDYRVLDESEYQQIRQMEQAARDIALF